MAGIQNGDWSNLTKQERLAIYLVMYKKLYWKRAAPVRFALRTAVATFSLLFVMPLHPLAIPTAIGGGLFCAWVTHHE